MKERFFLLLLCLASNCQTTSHHAGMLPKIPTRDLLVAAEKSHNKPKLGCMSFTKMAPKVSCMPLLPELWKIIEEFSLTEVTDPEIVQKKLGNNELFLVVIKDIELKNLNFQGKSFANLGFDKVTFVSCNFDNTKWISTFWRNISFEQCILSKMDFSLGTPMTSLMFRDNLPNQSPWPNGTVLVDETTSAARQDTSWNEVVYYARRTPAERSQETVATRTVCGSCFAVSWYATIGTVVGKVVLIPLTHSPWVGLATAVCAFGAGVSCCTCCLLGTNLWCGGSLRRLCWLISNTNRSALTWDFVELEDQENATVQHPLLRETAHPALELVVVQDNSAMR